MIAQAAWRCSILSDPSVVPHWPAGQRWQLQKLLVKLVPQLQKLNGMVMPQ